MVSALKLPVLKTQEYDLWSMRMEQYITFTNHALWEVIVNGDSVSPVASASAGAEGPIPHKTTEQKLARKNELKAKRTLMLAIPNEHLLKFHACKDAKSLWEAIKNRFGGNKESKKMHKTILKQNYENFVASSQKGLDKTYNSTNETLNTAHSVSAASSKDQASTASYANDVMFKKGEGYYAVPFPYTGNYMPPRADLSFAGLDDSVFKSKVSENVTSVPKIETNASKTNNDSLEKPKTGRSSASLIKEWESDIKDENVFKPKEVKKTVKPSLEKIEFVNARNTTVENENKAEKPRQFSQSPKQISHRAAASVSAARRVNTAATRLNANDALPTTYSYFKTHSPDNVVKSSACWIWRPKGNLIDHISKDSGSYTLKRFDYIDPQGRLKHMTGNKSYLTDYQEIDGGFVAFGGNAKGGKITGKGIKNQMDHKVKTIRCDNETVFKNRIMNEFCEMKGIRREFSVARTPQQNGVAERKNRTLIEAARTMLADSKLPTTFRAEAVNTACYVQNRVLVIKPHNKTPYELFLGRKPALSFMRPFGCPIIILNTLDHLGKFDGKSDDGFFVGYFINSKAFRVFNTRTRFVEENLHINFLENKPNVARTRPNWMFDIDTLTMSMNYQPLFIGNQTNGNAGTKVNINAGQARKKTVPGPQYVLIPLLTSDSQGPNSSEDEVADDAGKKGTKVPRKENGVQDSAKECDKNDQEKDVKEQEALRKQFEQEFKRLFGQGEAANTNNTNRLNIVSSPHNDDTGIFSGAYDDEVEGAVVDFNNLDPTIVVSHIPTTRIHKDHPKEQIIGDPLLAPQTRRMTQNSQKHAMVGKHAIGTKWVYRNKKDEREIVVRNKAILVAQGHTQEEGINYDEFFAPVAKIEAIRLFLAYVSFMGFIVYQMNVKSAFLYGTLKDEVYVCQPPGFEDSQFPNKVYKVENALYGLHQAPRAWYETLSTYLLENGFRRGIIDKTLFIKKDTGDILLVQVQDKYVADILKKFDFSSVKTVSTPIETNKTFLINEEAEDVDVHLYRSLIGSLMYLTASRTDIMFAIFTCARLQVTPKVSHLHAVKRIFRYLKGQPKLGLWYPKDSPFDLEAFSDSDYAGASLDMKFTKGGCQFLGKRLISWQCKKQTVVANLTTEAEYVATANCYGHVLWIQNQMLDYGFNLMNTKIYIENESIICIVKNTVYHSKTKHIEIRHHFIRDFYEKRVIQIGDGISDEFKVKTDSCKVSAARQKTDGNTEFPQIVDFLTTSSIHYAVTIDHAEPFNDVYVTPVHTKNVFTNMKRQNKDFSGTITPLIASMLVPQVVEGEGSGQPSEPQPPSSTAPPSHEEHSSGPPKKVGDEAVYVGEDDRVGTGSGSGPRFQDTTLGDADAQTRFETASKQSYDPPLLEVNTSRSGEDSMKHQDDLTDFVPPTPHHSPLLEGHTTGSDEKVKRLEKKQRERTPRMNLFKIGTSRRQSLDKENISKQGRNLKTRPMFEECDINDSRDDINDMVDEAMKNVEGDIVNDAATTRVSAGSASVTTAGMRSEKAKEKGVAFRDVEESARPIKILPTIDPKDKGKGIMQEPKKPLKNPRIAQIQLDKELSKRMHKEEMAELEKRKSEIAAAEEASRATINQELNDIQAMIEADEKMASRLQSKEQEQFIIGEKSKILVMKRFESVAQEGYDLILWRDLKTMIEPNEEDELWRNQQE
nr:hypothetical protein [Tanacetum cinerariifolium]